MRLLLLLCFLATTPALGQSATSISVMPERIVAGEKATLTFDAPVNAVITTYRPNSAIPIVDTLVVGGFTSVRWTPERAGVVRIAVPDGPSRNVSVRFSELPTAGLLVLILAGLILFGGAAWAMRKLLSEGPPRTLPEVRPDT